MNLTKYFNFKFLKENIKQAKGILIFFTSILPLVTIIYLIAKLSGGNYIYSFKELGILAYLLSFIVPVVIAFVFFGFIFKKKSVDFYLSQPINRKTIFVTNYFGGLTLLFLSIVVSTIIMLVFSFVTPLVLPIPMLIDYFIFFLITYFFMYSVATLAMSLSGNLVTSLIVSILIICMVPFLKMVNEVFVAEYTNTYIYCSSDICKSLSKENKQPEGYNKISVTKDFKNFFLTTPVSYFNNYQTKNVVYTLFVTIIYSVLSFISFNKRKMENNECSFKNNTIYNVVKCLTLLPFAFICFLIIKEFKFTGWLIFIFLTLIYFIVYDLLTKKRIEKFILNFNLFILCMVILHGIYFLWTRVSERDIYLKDIDSITLSYQDDTSSLDTIKNYSNIVIDDKKYIEKLISANFDYSYNYKISYSIELNVGNKTYTSHLNLSEKDNSIKEYIKKNKIKEDISNVDYTKINAILINNQKYDKDNKLLKLLDEAKESINENINFATLNLYYYENHDLKEIEYPVGKSKALATYVSNLFNREFMENLQLNNMSFYGLQNESRDSFEAFKYIINNYQDSASEFINYLEEHENDEVSDKYYFITMYNKNYKTYQYIINDINSFDELYQKILDKYQDDSNVEYFLKESQNRY